MATIYDIAERADVSTATVSRVLNGSARVSDGTRKRVEDAADALNYRPHVTAKSLARQKSDALSVVIPVMANDFYVNVLRGMQEALDETDARFDLIAFAASNPHQAGKQIERASQRGRSEGLLLLSMTPSDEGAERLLGADIPVVLVDAAHSAFDSVAMDNVLGGYLATQHLIDEGYERIAHITVPPGESVAAAERLEGYKKALREDGREVDPALVVKRGEPPYEFREETGYEAMTLLLDRDDPIDAVFAVSDTLALGALDAVKTRGLSVPEDVAMIGFDDIRVSRHVGLSTLSQPMRELGTLAVEKLLHRLKDPDRSPSSTVFKPSLIARSSSTKSAS